MPSSIVQRQIVNSGGEVDTRIQLSNSNFARAHGIQTWNSLRFALRYSMLTTLSADIQSTPLFAMGFCSGNTDGCLVLDQTTKNFAGIFSTATSWVWHINNVNGNLSSPAYVAGYTLGTKLSTTFTPNTATSTTAVISASAGFKTRTMVIIDIIKGSPYILRGYWQTINDQTIPGNGFGDPSLNDLFVNVEQPLPTYHNTVFSLVSGTVFVDEVANGPLDNICAAWNRTPDKMEISDITVTRLS